MAPVLVHCCHTHLTDQHYSMINTRGMALKESEVLGWPPLKRFGSTVGLLQNGSDDFKAGRTALKQANGYKTVRVSNQSTKFNAT